MEPLISVIIPAYNIQEYIGRCLDSVIDQTYKNLEIIVVNDGSTDHTGAVIDQYASLDKRIIVFHIQNGGVYRARNLGIKAASGEYIGFIDGDDMAESDLFESLLNGILEYDADISCCGYKKIYPGKVTNHYNTKSIITLDKTQTIKDYLNARLTDGVLWAKLYRAKLFDNITMNEDIRFLEDFSVNYYLFSKANKTVYIGGLKHNYIIRKNSIVNTKANISLMENAYRMINTILNHAGPLGSEIYPAALNAYLRYLNIISLFALKSDSLDNECAEFKKKIEDELKKNVCYIIKTKEIGLRYKIHTIGVVFFKSFYSWMYKRVIYRKLFRKK